MNLNPKKQTHPESSSLSTFANNIQNSQATKKAISTDQISMQAFPTHLQRISSYHNIILPFETNIKSFIKHLLMKLEEKGTLILYSDQQQGQILIQREIHKNCLTSLLDCLCLCRKEGWPKESISQSYQAVSIIIKREYIEYRCRVKIRANCTKQKASVYLIKFMSQTIQVIKKCLQSFKDAQEETVLYQVNQESPLAMQISANQRTYDIFISNSYEDKIFKTLYNQSLQKIKSQMHKYKSALEKQQQNNSKNKQKPIKKQMIKLYSVMEAIVNQSDNIFNFCQSLRIVSAPNFHPDYALYSIEGLFCYKIFPELFNLYKRDMVKHCQLFNKNSQFINKNISSKQYFDYLEVRPKFRLQSSTQPYDLAINALRQLQNSLTLREALLCMQKTFSFIKVCCLYEHDGKLDISSMDDILPVMIYVVAKAQVIDFPVYVKIIDDYIKIRGIFELQERVATTLYVAAQDICKKLPKVSEDP